MIFIRPHCLSVPSFNSTTTTISTRPSVERLQFNSSLEFFDRIRRILHREQSFPQLTLSSSRNISESDFERHLVPLMKMLEEEYLERQEKVRIELENKERYLHDFEQTQFLAYEELKNKVQIIEQRFQILKEQYEQVKRNISLIF